jgi:subtilisin family serine protease
VHPVARTTRRLLPVLLTLLLGAAALAAAAPAGAAADDPFAKVDKAVADQLGAKGETSFIAIMKDSASLTGATAVQQHGQRAAFVHQRLTQAAQQSQGGLRALLDAKGVRYQSFWIVNAVEVSSADAALVKEVAARDDVARVAARQTYKLIEPTKGKAEAKVDAEVDGAIQAVEWNIDRVRAPEVWSTFNDRGEGIVVASIDSGVDFTHPALVAKYRGNLGGGQFDHNYNWFDPAHVCPSAAPCDNNDHGTHTMGTMVGDDGAGNQIGVAPNARWIAAKGCETNTCSDASLLASGQWIVAPTDLNGQNPRPDLAPNVVNNSWGGGPGDAFYQGIVNSWVAAGIFPAFSAGNDGPACGTAGSPGDYVNSYAAGNHTINNTINAGSSRGASEFGGETKPNIAAPGTNVRSSVPGGFDSFTGTSMASPHVSGTVALMWSAAPALLGDIATTRQLLDDTAIDTFDGQCGGTPDDNNVWGEGRLDAFAAVQASPRGATGTLGGTVTDSASGQPVAGATVRVTGPNDRVTTSAADGTWQLTLSTGSYSVQTSKFAYDTQTTTAEVVDGQTTTVNVALVLTAAHRVSGTVRDDFGAPVGGATVTIAGTPIPPATTGADGTYSFASVPEGSYDVDATAGACLGTQRQQLVVDGDETLDFTIPSRRDAFGHICRPSEFSFIDAGTVLPLTGDDASTQVQLPFPVFFYGQTYTSAFVNTNGHVNFLANVTPGFSNVALPNTATPNAAVYAFWDDFIIDTTGGITATVRTETVGTAPNRKFVVEWRNARLISGSSDRQTFEIVLWENGRVQVQYKELGTSTRGHGDSATVGIENHTGTDALQYSFNQPVLVSNSSITFRRPGLGFVQGVVSDANDGLPVAGATVRALQNGNPVAQATTNSAGVYRFQLPLGTYTIEATATGYGPATAQAVVDEEEETVVVNLSLPAGRPEVSPTSIEVVAPSGERRTRGFTLRNTGGATLVWNLVERQGGATVDVPWLAATPTSGGLAPDGTQAIGVLIDATGLAPGIYDAQLVIVGNGGRQPETTVAVRLIVPAYQTGVNAGGSRYVDAAGDTWQADKAFTAGSYGYMDNGKSTRNTTNKAIAGTTEDGLYQSQRENAFEYRFANVPNGVYEIDLRFAELKQQRPNKRLFDVIVENQLLLPAHDIALEVGSFAADNQVFNVRVTDGTLNVRLVARAGFSKPVINAVRVTERPDRA